MEQFKGLTRLPKFAIPQRYDLHLKLDLSACTFSGTELIDLNIIQVTKFLVLNALELHVHKVWFTNSHNQFLPTELVLDGDDEILVLAFDEALSVGDGVLGIEFSGALNEYLRGLYRCTFMDGGEKKNMAVTQFEAVDARRCFPCWDEPALKATFKITLDVPSELVALSNMPVINEKHDGNIKTVYFEETPIMSTYLVGIVVGRFDYIEDTAADGVKVRVHCPVGKSDKGEFALHVAVKTLDYFTKYFSMPYSLPKLDMVGVPEFSAGAMENYGLITYRENELLYDHLHSPVSRKQRISYMATDILFPEWKIWTKYLGYSTEGLSMDALEISHPIEVEIDHARSVVEIFDAISYEKGSAVIRMLQSYLGDEIFQESGVDVSSMMDVWTKKKGYPVISVKINDNILEFEQSQFQLSGENGDGQWIVPITMSVGSYHRSKNFLLETKLGKVDISDLIPSHPGNSSPFNEKNKENFADQLWIKVNIEQSGFYRVNYENELNFRLRNAIENNLLSASDKFGILDDAYALCLACKQPLSALVSLMNVYRKEMDYVVLSRLIEICYDIMAVSSDAIPDSANELNQFFINLLLFPARKLGWESVPGESNLNALLRGEVLRALATFDHDKTHEEALYRFQSLLNDKNTPLVSADTSRALYIAIMRNSSTSNRKGYESLLKIYRESDSVQVKEGILRCLATSPDPDIVVEVLNFLLSDEVRFQDINYGLAGLNEECCEVAWKWMKENWDLILAKYGVEMLLANFINCIVALFCSNEKADEVEAFFESRTYPSIARTLKRALERIRIKARWVENIKQDQSLHQLLCQLATTKS
ncbi:hypothetical protein FEM48_Zijuj01G0276600 [Ziziphus jujuba var. spinosa]|uniref:Aminopeptidase n=1 Tax=Ziziphus jujuba var. spinosa TaxID=714518 RepID=A0A978W596_ZIZJJ|nr:hypothetical protein FEM48_Zijuj01G0276600 [Ziziphus jujuba var. spinosa]